MSILGIAFLASDILNIVALNTYCNYVVSYTPHFDVPMCSGSSCEKAAYPYKNHYAFLVGEGWKSLNKFRERYVALQHSCTLDFLDENGEPISSNVSKVISNARGLYYNISQAVHLSAAANRDAVFELQTLIDKLEEAGIDKTTENGWLGLYNDLVLVVEDINNGTEHTKLGWAWKHINPYTDPIRAKELREFALVGLSIANVSSHIPIFAPVVNVIRSAHETYILSDSTLYDYINASIGLHDSVRSYIANLASRYAELKKDLDDAVDERQRDFEDNLKYIRDVLTELEDENLSVLVSFMQSRTYVGEIRTNIDAAPSYTLALVAKYDREWKDALNRYKTGYKFLAANEEMKDIEQKVSDLRKEVERFEQALNSSIDECRDTIKSYDFYDDSLKALAALELVKIKNAETLTQKVSHCEKALDLLNKDKKYRDVLKAYEECKKIYEKRWKEKLECSGEPIELYECCTNMSQKKENEFLTSQQYLRYKDLYNTLYTIAVSQGLDEFLLRLLSIPKEPWNYDELYKNYSKLLSLTDDLAEWLSVSVETNWSGFLSADGVSDVTLSINNTLSFPAKGSVDVPFEYLGFHVEGNGLLLEVSGKKVKYSGEGSARIVFQAAPVEVEETVLSFSEGSVQLRLKNNHYLPVSYYFPYKVLSYGDGAYYEDGYLYLYPGATVIVERPALDIHPEVSGETVAFLVRNTSPYRYEGTITFDVNATSGPSYCFIGEGQALCKIDLSPGEERLVKFRGTLLEDKDLSFSPPTSPPPQTEIQGTVALDTSTVEGTLEEFEETLSRLESYWDRAEELNVTDLLPFDKETLDNVKHLDDNLKKVALPVLKNLDNEVKNEAQARTKLLESLAENIGSEDLKNAALLAKKNLLTGDYITPLALSKGALKYLDSKSKSFDPALILAFIVVGLIVYLIKMPKERRQRKRRIPRF